VNTPDQTEEILGEGAHLRLLRRGGWEFAERRNTAGVVAIVALTPDRCILMLEQYREPIGLRVVEIPAGLIDYKRDGSAEAADDAAHRELMEETGFQCETIRSLGGGPTSAGMSTETLEFFVAMGCKKVERGGGVEGEDIVVTAVPLDELHAWIATREAAGAVTDPKVWAGLWLAARSGLAEVRGMLE
jgi:ADP-ribose pyrophosphatase